MKGLSLKEIAYLLEVPCDNESQVFGYKEDSRIVGEGDLFFALLGERVNGHRFLKDVATKKAAGAVVSKSYRGEDFGLPLLRVPDVLLALQKLAKETLDTRVIGITGSLGKTTTKEFLFTLLEKKFRVHKSPKNYNSGYGLPLAILNRKGGEDFLILEYAMRQKGDIAVLTEIAPPDIALITNVDYVHAGNFSDGLQGIAHAKGEIFSRGDALGFIEKSLEKYPFLQKYETFSMEDPLADLYLEEGFFLKEGKKVSKKFSFPFTEKAFLHDFLAAAKIARHLGLSFAEIIERVPYLKTPKMRFEKVLSRGILLINDAYNASPESTRLALASMPGVPGKKVAVLGQMVDYGELSSEMHRKVGEYAAKYVDLLLCTGEECRLMLEAFEKSGKKGLYFDKKEDLKKRARAILQEGDAVLIKASRKYAFEEIFSYLL